MGLTLGALLFVATLAYVMLIKPLPYPEQEKLFTLTHQLVDEDNNIDGYAFTYPNLMHLYQHQQVFSEQALLYIDGAVITSLTNNPMMHISYVTPEWFTMLDAPMAVGRRFQQSEKLGSYHPVAIIDYQTWQREFNGDADILNKKIDFGDKSFAIVGVLAQSHHKLSLASPSFKSHIYIPWDFNTVSERNRKKWGNDDSGLMYLAKASQHTMENLSDSQIGMQLTQLINENWQQQVQEIAFFKDWRINIVASPLNEHIIADSKNSLYLLIIGAIGLLLIACANIANLFISRFAERQHQLAICAAIGANRKQLFTTLVAEIGVLMFGALVLAQSIAAIGFTSVSPYLQDYLPRVSELTLNSFSYAFSFSLLWILVLGFSLIAVKMIRYQNLSSSMQSSGKGNSFQVSNTVRKLLVISQITVASCLIFINILLYSNAQQVINQPLGYQPSNSYAVVLSPYANDKARAAQMNELRTKLSESAKIARVSQAMRPSIFATLALTAEKTNQRYTAAAKDIDEHYFPLIEQAIIQGENFTRRQIDEDEKVIIVNESFANKLAPDGNILGLRFASNRQVIGVVKDIYLPGDNIKQERFYYPVNRSRNMLLIRMEPGQTLTRAELLQQLQSVNKQLNIFSFATLNEYNEQLLFRSTVTAQATIILTIITCLLSGIGLYGILKYTSEIRRFEIATRMAVGAKGKDIIRLIFNENLPAIAIGFAISLMILGAIYLNFNQVLTSYSLLEGLISFVGTSILITLLTLYACYLPLRQYIKQPVILNLRHSE